MKRIIAVLSLLFFPAIAFTQQGYNFNRISTEDGIGLASNVVYATYQDPKGFLWVGTANGLQRFDGSKFIQYSSGNDKHASLPVSDLTQIIPAGGNSLWLVFSNKMEVGIFNLSTFHYTVVPIKPKGKVLPGGSFRLWKDISGEVYLTVFRYGILHYNTKTSIFDDDNHFQLPKGWEPTAGHFQDPVTKRYWFPCYAKGLAMYDPKTEKLYTQENNPQNNPILNNAKANTNVSEFFIDSKRRYWIFGWTGGQYKNCFDSVGNPLRDTSGLNSYDNQRYFELRNFFETRKGVLWIYGMNGLYNFDKNSNRFVYYENGSTNDAAIDCEIVHQVTEDHDGSIWVATDNGLYFTSPGSSSNNVVNRLFNTPTGSVEFTDILELKTQQIWLATWGKGIMTLTKEMKEYDAGVYSDMPRFDEVIRIQYRQAWALYQHTDGKVWIGCQAGKYIIHDPVTGHSRFLTDPAFKGSTIMYITGDKKGNLWLGTLRGDLIKYDGKTFKLMQELGSKINKILIDKEGLMWVSSFNKGLYRLNVNGDKIVRHYTMNDKENPLFMNAGKDIEQLNDSIIVFGAGAMNFINKRTNKVHWLSFDDGLPSNTLQRIRVDGDGYLWMITLNGLCRYNPITGRVTPYGRRDGITLSHRTTEADYFTSTGKIMFTGVNALIYFNPAVFHNSPPPDVTITDFKVFNNYIPVDSLLALPKIQLKNDQNSFSIYFAALSYLERDKFTYYYEMSKVDKDWIKADREWYKNYSFLPPGHYTFSVYCENIDGTRSKDITEIHIYIKPPFWRTYWFICFVLFLVALVIYGLHRMRVNKLLAVEKLRNRVARDLHDDMGSTLSTINILSSMAISRMNTDKVKTAEYLGKIGDNSQRMMDAMDDIVWSIKPSNDSMQKIAARMREFSTSVLEAKGIELDFRMDEAVFDITLNMEARRDLFLVFKEAVNNAAKYSQATMVVIRVGLHVKRLVLLVEDNGVGFDPAIADSGNGLGNMQKRASAMRGRLQIQSKPGEGAHITLNIPAS